MPKKPLINYTSRNFESIKEDLIEHAKRYYPDRYNDFNESSFGSLIFDSVAYVGDIMSFYLDFQVNESFLETALEYSNVRKAASQMGYNFYGKSSTFGHVDLFILVPAMPTDIGPRTELFPVVKTGTRFKSANGAYFTLTEDVDFNHPNVDVVAARFDPSTGKATHFAMRSTGQVKSGATYTKDIDVGPYTRFLKERIGPPGINEIISVFDSEGNEYYQVDHLSQEVIYFETTNQNAKNDGVRSILKPYSASRRFVLEQDDLGTYLQFGYGSENEFDTTGIIDPSTVMLNMNGKNYVTDDGFDPNKLISTDKFGIVPSNTTLRVRFGSNNLLNVNTARNALNTVDGPIFDFPNDQDREYFGLRNSVIESLEVANPDPIVYDATLPTVDEIKYRAYGIYSSQNRIVTKRDYEAYCYQMPPKFGSIKRVSVYNDPSGTNKRLCLYVISNDNNDKLVEANSVTKNNLKTWLNKNKIISDLIDIKDAKIINVGIDYEFVVSSKFDRLEVFANVNQRVRGLYRDKYYIGEPLYITDVYNIVNKTKGVVDCLKVRANIKNTSDYSQLSINIDDILSKDGTYINTPQNCILEIKYLNKDIKGTIVWALLDTLLV